MIPRYYAGIGSRDTPPELEPDIAETARVCNARGYTLRSGAAPGADTMFERYADRAEIFLPWKCFNKHLSPLFPPSPEAFERAAKTHPAWHRCSEAARKLHARNVHQILGADLNTPVEFVVCWTPNGEIVGGTALGIKLARSIGVVVYNLGAPGLLPWWRSVLKMPVTVT